MDKYTRHVCMLIEIIQASLPSSHTLLGPLRQKEKVHQPDDGVQLVVEETGCSRLPEMGHWPEAGNASVKHLWHVSHHYMSLRLIYGVSSHC